MKALFVLILLLTSSLSFAQDADVAKAVETLKQGLLDGKKEILEKITHENLTYGHSSGQIENKTEFIEALVTGKSDFTAITLSDQVIKITGNVATVRHKLLGENTLAGKTNTLNLSVLLVFVKEKGEWKLLARQAVKIVP
jgi:hypothetical protein